MSEILLIWTVATEDTKIWYLLMRVYTLQSACSCLYLAGTLLSNMTSGSSKLTETSHWTTSLH